MIVNESKVVSYTLSPEDLRDFVEQLSGEKVPGGASVFLLDNEGNFIESVVVNIESSRKDEKVQ